jgi:hypothetical protein
LVINYIEALCYAGCTVNHLRFYRLKDEPHMFIQNSHVIFTLKAIDFKQELEVHKRTVHLGLHCYFLLMYFVLRDKLRIFMSP